MKSPLSEAAETALATFRHHRALAIANSEKAEQAMDQFLQIVSYGEDALRLGRVPNCVAVWTEWLDKNGPNTRQHIIDATGVKFTEAGTPHTILWKHGDSVSDDRVPANTIVRFKCYKGPNEGRGAAPTVYALWSQRYDVLPKFGVGPEKPSDLEALGRPGWGYTDVEPQATEPLLGIVTPPDGEHPPTWDDLVAGAKPWPEQSFDFAVMDESQSNEDGDGDGSDG